MKRILSLALLSVVLGGCVVVPAARYDDADYRGRPYYRDDSYRGDGYYRRDGYRGDYYRGYYGYRYQDHSQ